MRLSSSLVPSIALCLIASVCLAETPFYPYEQPDPEEQISRFIRRIHEDAAGNFWFGTNGDGAYRYDGHELKRFPLHAEGAPVAVRAMREDDVLWFGTSAGVVRFDGENFVYFTDADGLPHADVWSMCIDSSGTLWVGTYGGACRFDRETQRFVAFDLPPAKHVDRGRGVSSLTLIHDIEEDRAGNLWFAIGTDGVRRYDGETITSITTDDGLPDGSVNDLLEDRRGNLWFATHWAGICRFDGEKFMRVGPAEGVEGVEAWSLYEDSHGNVWFPTEGNGVYRYDGSTYTNYGRRDGLASGAVQCVLEDGAGRIWVGGHLGLYRLDESGFVNVTKNGPWP